MGRWQQRYAAPEYVYGTEPNLFLRSFAHWIPAGGRVLSVADGEGRNSVWLARCGYRVDAFDGSSNAVEKARLLAARHQVQVNYAVENILLRPWQAAAYDGVAAIMIQFLKPEQRDRVFEFIEHTLKPGGILLLTGYRPEQIGRGTGGPSQPEQMYTEEMLRRSFAGMELLHLQSYEAHIQEGAGHHGFSALIDLVARRGGATQAGD
ncbi:MAG: class I SAM-dependent methyltransferase [Phycisphaerae bacterium]|nr:class I SAM-dependent methyltransferase [Phycisphaerae bacterium]